MAVLNQIELPNGTTYDISDASARKLDNNDFDTINVTELNAGDVIVTGAARFLNTINGDISGNAETATSATKATQDESGNNIKSTYANAISISDHTITLKNKNGTSLGTVTVPDNNTTYTVATGTANGKIKVTPSSGSAYEVSVYGLKSAAYKDVTDSYSATGTDPVSGKAVAAALNSLPEPMVFKGSLGTGGTVTALPVDGTAKVGDTYKVITAGIYASKAAKVGDTFICLTKTSSANTWELIPSGDEPSGTVTSVAIANGGGLSVSGSPITSSGTIYVSHADTSSQASVDNSGRTYIQDISLDTYGHVTKITSATETVVNTDRYVNSAAFADATSADANNPVKMTLTRAGSDTASVTAYLPKVSSSSAGVAPKGAAVSSQSQSTKFLREDGTWAAPSYTTNTNTTYSLSASGESIVLTGSDSSTSTADLSGAFDTYLPLAGGQMTGDIIIPKNDNMGIKPNTNNYGEIGHSNLYFYRSFITHYYGTTSHVINWDSNGNIGSSATSSAASTRGYVNFYNACAAGGTQTKTSLVVDSTTASNITLYMPNKSGTLALTSDYVAKSGDTMTGNLTAPKFIGTLQGNADTATSATSATTANYVSLVSTNEIRLASKPSTAQTVHVGYKWSDNTSAALINRWRFCNGNGAATEVEASTFYGALSGNATSATTASKLGSSNVGSATQPIYLNAGTATACTYTLGKSVPSDAVFTDTKNTAGSTDTSSKIYLIGATSQAANPQTYSQDTAYVGTDGCLYSGGNKVEVVSNNAGYHNSVYRGKSLGTSITTAQWNAISAGTFDDMYIGDYWTLSTTIGSTTSNIQYVIAGFDYWWNCGDSYPQSSNKHHVVLVPASNLYSAQMNATNITTGGYIGSAMYTTNLANARTGISNLFGDHLYSVRRLFTNTVNTVGQATGWAWATSSVDLMNENMVYGSSVWTTSGFEVGVDRTILPLFALNPASASIYSSWWLRSVATPPAFAFVYDYGFAPSSAASDSRGVRPAFAIY